MKQTKTAAPPPQKGQKSAMQAPQYDWGDEQVTGMERVSTEDLGIPFLVIIQKGSPEVDKTHKDYPTKKISGAEAGDVINTVSRVILHKHEGEPIIFVPCTYERMFPEWRPRDSGGGFVKHHRDSSILTQCQRSEEDGRDYLPNGNVIVTTAYFFGFVIHDAASSPDPCVISMSSTQLKAARAWLNIIMGLKVDSPSKGRITPPMFSHKYALTTIPQQNAEGSWFGWSVECAGIIDSMGLIEFGRQSARQMSLGMNRPQLAAPPQQEQREVPI